MKPENIFLVGPATGSFHVKVLDFGISKIVHSHSPITRDHSILGTPYYMSPEQAEGLVNNVDHQTDIFALGAICYQVLSRQLPFDAPTIPGVIYQVCHGTPRPLRNYIGGLPLAVEQVVGRALAKQKPQRYQRIDDFARDLASALAGASPVNDNVTDIARRRIAIPVNFTPDSLEADPDSMAVTQPLPIILGEQPFLEERTTADGPKAQREQTLSSPPKEAPQEQAALAEPLQRNETLDLEGSQRLQKILTVAFVFILLVIGGLLAIFGLPQKNRRTESTALQAPPLDATSSQDPKGSAAVKNNSAPSSPSPLKPLADPNPAPQNPALPAANTVQVDLQGLVPGARVLIDGVLHTKNPLVLPKTGKLHWLKVEAQGYKTFKSSFRANASLSVMVRREKLGAAKTKYGPRRFNDLLDGSKHEPKSPKRKSSKQRFTDL
jgi:serine/threonine protein kinase